MTDEETLAVPLTVLGCSPTGRLPKVRRNNWLPYGARAMRAGVAITESGELLGWVAYADRADDLATPSWPQQALPLSFDQIFPAVVEINVVYRGPDWRRATGSANAHLGAECGVSGARIDLDSTERAHRSVASRHAAEAHMRARREFDLRLAG